jgi:HAE1 family hydrophobic/amphiphilic exporter-1
VGTAVVGGMLLSTVLNLAFIPVLYVLLKSFLESFKKTPPTGLSDREIALREPVHPV